MAEQLSSEAGLDFDGAGDSSVAEPTVAAFSPNQQTSTRSRNRASILIHQKSPLVTATPPQVTRALAYSHPFILPLNYLAGLLTWSTGDPWESFLLVVSFWFTTLYGDTVIRWGGPVVFISALILGIYSRRYNPLSRKNWSVTKKQKSKAGSSTPQQRKSLDEILETLQTFSSRCEVLTDPFLRLTEFLTTQTTATTVTTRPALFSLFIRISAITPVWFALTLPPVQAITTSRVVIVFGTLALTWHSLPARASRTILWRSHAVRLLAALLTGLDFSEHTREGDTPAVPPLVQQATTSAQQSLNAGAGVRFTFALFENQRRWIGLGYTDSMLPTDRAAWTDEHLNACESRDAFPLPDTDFTAMRWRWVPGSEWRVDRGWTDDYTTVKGTRDPEGWTYYDNRWDYAACANTWGKYTRRRRWVRDAELVETGEKEKEAGGMAETAATTAASAQPARLKDSAIDAQSVADSDAGDTPSYASGVSTPVKKKGWFGKRRLTNETLRTLDKAEVASMNGSVSTGGTLRSRDPVEDDVHTPIRFRESQWDRSIGDGLVEGLS